MHPHRQILSLVSPGRPVTISFTKHCDQLEDYPVEGMKARVLNAREMPHDNEVLKLVVDFAPYEAHNRALETKDFTDRHGKSDLTAREAGKYDPQRNFYLYLPVDPNDQNPEVFTIDSDERTALFARYQASGTSDSYIGWLEAQVLKFQS